MTRRLLSPIVALALLLLGWATPAGALAPTTAPAARTLVVIVPGAFGNADFWPVAVAGKATFGSELRRAAGPGTEVYPFLWASALNHQTRLAAARNLADLIDRKGLAFDRVAIVGHSHGGNVALLAAGLCKRRIDLLVCLSTPHPHLRLHDADRGDLELPIYCSAEALANVGAVVALCPDTDAVPDRWADFFKGLDENQGIALTTGWRERFGHPRLRTDGMWDRLVGTDNLVARRAVRAPGVHNLAVPCFVKDQAGVRPHYAIHSRRMGEVVGQLVRSGATDAQLDYLATLVLPADADNGEPIAQADHDRWREKNAQAFARRGWRLEKVDVALAPAARDKRRDLYVRLATPDGKKTRWTTTTLKKSTAAAWPLADRYLWSEDRARLDLFDDGFWSDTCLGSLPLAGSDATPPTAIPATGNRRWSANLRWTSVHW